MEKIHHDINTKMISKRIEWVDIAKGIAIILVCLGHGQTSLYVKKWLYSFHLPLFLFLAGYITVNTDYCDITDFLAYGRNALPNDIESLLHTAGVFLILFPVCELINRYAPWMEGKTKQ